jgi:hypothetical protein
LKKKILGSINSLYEVALVDLLLCGKVGKHHVDAEDVVVACWFEELIDSVGS